MYGHYSDVESINKLLLIIQQGGTMLIAYGSLAGRLNSL